MKLTLFRKVYHFITLNRFFRRTTGYLFPFQLFSLSKDTVSMSTEDYFLQDTHSYQIEPLQTLFPPLVKNHNAPLWFLKSVV